MPDIPLVDIPDGRVATVLATPRTAVVVRHITECVDGTRKKFLVEITTIAKQERYRSQNLVEDVAQSTYAGNAVFLKSASWSS